MSQTTSNLLYLVTIICFILALRFLSSPTHGAARQLDRRGRDGDRDRRHAALQTGVHVGWRIDRRRRDRRGVRSGRGAAREDDRDAADGGAVQRRRRRRGGARRRSRSSTTSPPTPGRLHGDVSLAIVLAALIGSVSFAGSMVAFAKLQELIQGRPITYPGQQFVNLALVAAIVAAGIAIVAGAEQQWLLVAADPRLARLRRAVRAADRRRRHAGRDLAAERVHGPRRRGDRLRARLERADRQRRARRCLRNAADDDDGPGDEPLDRERPLRRVRQGAGGRRRGGGARGHGALGDRGGRLDHALVRAQGRDRARATGWRSRRRSTRCASSPTSSRRRASRSTTRSTRSPAACRGT